MYRTSKIGIGIGVVLLVIVSAFWINSGSLGQGFLNSKSLSGKNAASYPAPKLAIIRGTATQIASRPGTNILNGSQELLAFRVRGEDKKKTLIKEIVIDVDMPNEVVLGDLYLLGLPISSGGNVISSSNYVIKDQDGNDLMNYTCTFDYEAHRENCMTRDTERITISLPGNGIMLDPKQNVDLLLMAGNGRIFYDSSIGFSLYTNVTGSSVSTRTVNAIRQ